MLLTAKPSKLDPKPLYFGLLVLSLTGCASVQTIEAPVWLSASKFDLRRYSDARVAILPIVFSSAVKKNEELSRTLQKQIAANANVLGLQNVHVVKQLNDNLWPVGFPYTPKRLAEIGKAVNADAVIGARIVSYRLPDRFKSGNILATIEFVDSVSPSRYWGMTGVWEIGGESNVASTISWKLAASFAEVHDLLREEESGAQRVWRALAFDKVPPYITIAAPPDELETDRPRMRVDVSVADVFGIKKVTVSNHTTNVKNVLFDGNLEKTRLPSFSSQKSVPLVLGENAISVMAENSRGYKATRTITVVRTAAKERAWIYVVGIDDYLNFRPVKNAIRSARELVETYVRAGRVDAERGLSVLGEEATLRNVKKGLDFLRQTTGQNDRVVLYLGGRMAVDSYSVRLVPYDAEPGFLSATTLNLSDVAEILRESTPFLVIDFCSDEKMELATLRKLVPKVIVDDYALAVRHCENATGSLGEIMIEALKGAADGDGDTVISLSELVQFFKKNNPDVIIHLKRWSINETIGFMLHRD